MFGLYPDCFEHPDIELGFDQNELIRACGPSGRRLRITNRSAQMSDEQVATLVSLAEWRYLFSAYRPESGRTLNGVLKANSGWPVRGVKMKGGAGVSRKTGQYHLCPPMFGESYDFQTEYHLSLDSGFFLSSKPGSPKALNCLSAGNADREYSCQTRLAEHGLGHPGLLSGHLVDTHGNPLLDCHGQATGVSFSGFDPAFEILGYHMYFEFFDHGDSTDVLHPVQGVLNRSTGAHPVDILAYYMKMVKRIGEVKSRCTVEAKVGRHACHLGNLLYNPKTDLLLVTDTDSCVLLDQLPEDLRGPQILRDLVSDLFRTVKELAFCAHSEFGLAMMRQGRCLPIHQHLRGYFFGRVSQGHLETLCDILHEVLLSLIQDFHGELTESKAIYRRFYEHPTRRTAERLAKSCWHLVMLPFLAYAFPICYLLLKASDIPRQGFQLPEMGAAQFHEQVKEGLINHIGILSAESDETISKLGMSGQRKPGGLADRICHWVRSSRIDP